MSKENNNRKTGPLGPTQHNHVRRCLPEDLSFVHQTPEGENKERIFEKTTTERLTERPFTTQPKHYAKRGCNTVRTRAMLFVDQLRARGYTLEIPLEKAKQLFSEITGAWDRTTLKAYFGTLPGKSTQHIRRTARYQSGTFSFKNIELQQDIPKTKGYLEKLGMVSYEKHGKVWFMVLENLVIVSQLMKGEDRGSLAHCANVSIDNISLTPIPITSNSEFANACDVVTTENTQTNNNLQSEREISQVKVCDGEYLNPCLQNDLGISKHIQAYSNRATQRVAGSTEQTKEISPKEPQKKDLTEQEYSILHSALVERERLKCVDCGKIDPSNPYRIWCPKGKGERTRYDVCVLEGER